MRSNPLIENSTPETGFGGSLSTSLGVEYTPGSFHNEDSAAIRAAGFLRDAKYVRVQWVDLTNIVRFRVLPVEYFRRLLQTPRRGIAVGKVALGLVNLVVAPGFSPIGEYLYTVDMSTMRPCPFAPGHVSVMGYFQEKVPVSDIVTGEAVVDVALCSRTILKRIVAEAQTSLDVQFLVGFESEFILHKSDFSESSPVMPVNLQHDWSTSAGLASGTVEATVMQEIADAIQASGIELQHYHVEAAPGQYEVVTGPLPPLEAADALIHTREIIRNVASLHGLQATFAPRVFMDSAGSSTHTHISVHSGRHTKTAEGLSMPEASFLAALLEHLPAVPAITLPTRESYKRMADGVWSGGTYVCWGTENREAPIRLTNAKSPHSRNFEVRCIDATANPHLVLAAVLGAGLQGIRSKLPLEMPDCHGPESAAQMPAFKRALLCINKRLPLSWEVARDIFKTNAAMQTIFGQEFIEKYLAVNKARCPIL
ncbi:glutamine synthetase/guanido kinase [Fistulina hepatica ATCC 64428]|uniref:Glutamine synthetase n=1 Tax=Fistulina hepatica ATCC 64428 TaxID=1128425 RepID=A0A0D7A6D4_9AGAR|nr:glutamine synthetase/guanido kinase [Fistulina hepatica ATCC 64428]